MTNLTLKSKAIIELQSKEMFYDKEMYQQKYEKAVALHSNDYKPSITEELAMKKNVYIVLLHIQPLLIMQRKKIRNI